MTVTENGYIGFSHTLQSLIRFDKNFALRQVQVIGNDFHGIVYHNKKLYGVDTYHDKIYQYNTDTLCGIFSWNFSENLCCPTCNVSVAGNDFFHINDLFPVKDQAFISMFRDIPDITREMNDEGTGRVYVKNLNDIENNFGAFFMDGLSQPHTPVLYGKDFYVCDSKKASIAHTKINSLELLDPSLNIESRKDIQVGRGFTRGMVVNSKNIYVGISSSAKRTVENFKEVECGVVILDRKSGKETSFIPLPASEVYGILEV